MFILLLLALNTLCASYTVPEFSQAEKEIQAQLYVPNLYAPWRASYIKNSIEKDDKTPYEKQEKKGCPFCLEMNAHNDEKYLILRRFKHHCVVLNLYPYTKGHLLIVPFEHKAHLKDFSKEARTEMMEIATQSIILLQDILECPGVNAGLNLGRVAGASIPDHLHMQIIPRRNIDCSFIQIIGNMRVSCWDLKEMYKDLKPYFDAITL